MNSTPVIRERVTIGATSGSPNGQIAPQPGLEAILTAELTKTYVAGGALSWFTAYARTLSFAIDDVTADFGDDLYDRMMMDSQVSASVNVLKASILEEGLLLNPAIDDKDDPRYGLAVEINDWCGAIIEDMDTAIDTVLWDKLDAIPYGNKVSELVYRLDGGYSALTPSLSGPGRQLVLDRIMVKEREATAFVVDAYRNVIGLLARIPGVAWATQVGMVVGDPSKVPNLLPRQKFAILSHRPRNGDPRGQSILRPAYDPWTRKNQLKIEHLRYMTQFGTPSLAGFTAPGTQAVPFTDALGNPAAPGYPPQYPPAPGEPAGMPTPGMMPGMTVVTPEQVMVNALAALRNGSAIVFPHGAAVQVIHPPAGGADQFDRDFSRLDIEITKAIVLQTLATEEGQHQARAASEVHQDILGTLIRQQKNNLARMVRTDILRPMVVYNFGAAARDLVPQPSFGQTPGEDRSKTITAFAQIGYHLDESQMPAIDAELNLPVRQLTATDATPAGAGADAALPTPHKPTLAQQEVAGEAPRPPAEAA